METGQTFRYGISRPAWIMIGLLAVLAAFLVIQYVLVDLRDGEPGSVIGLFFVLLVVAVVLLPVPLMEMIWLVRGRVQVTAEGLRWRGWSGWNERAWGDILAVGLPAPDAQRQDDERIHVVTEDEYEFIHGFGLRDREALRQMLRGYGDLAEVEVIGKHTFLCRPGAGKIIRERAKSEVDPHDDVIDFWSGRFRRF